MSKNGGTNIGHGDIDFVRFLPETTNLVVFESTEIQDETTIIYFLFLNLNRVSKYNIYKPTG